MKPNKRSQAENISRMTKRFNDGSRLVCSEIISRCGGAVLVNLHTMSFERYISSNILMTPTFPWDFHRSNLQARVTAIEKWTAVADICRCLHNFNGVLQICAAFTNAAVFRLRKTWDKVPKTVGIYINLIISDSISI